MEVSSVTSGVSSNYGSGAPAQAQRKERAPQAEQAQAQERPETKRQEERRPAPVVNTQGQTTGRIVNTSA